MRGLKAVLYIAVLLCVAQFVAADCINGNFLDAASGKCICLSGYSGDDCNTPADAACHAGTASPTTADQFPSLDLTSAAYTNNTLRASISGPYVTGRRYNAITFVGQNETACGLGLVNSFWTTSIAACRDTFHIDLPWAHHPNCGFAPDLVFDDSTHDSSNEDNQTAIAEDHYISYKTKFTIHYTDLLGAIENITLTRNTSVPFQLFVRFPTRLDVSLKNVNIQSKVDMGFALTADYFDPVTHELTIELTMINSWPNMLEYDTTQWNWDDSVYPGHYISFPGQVSLIGDTPGGPHVGANYMDANTHTCENVEGSICKQAFQMSFQTSSCSFDGLYNYSIPLYTCRGLNYQYCTVLPFTISFDMETSSICSQINITQTLGGNLIPYLNKYDSPADAAMPWYNKANFGFTIGSYGYFQVELTNTQGNTISLEFFEISFQASGLTNKNYLMKNGVNVTSDSLPLNGNADSTDAFHYDEARLVVNNAAKGFEVYFSSVVFKVLPSTSTVYTFRASAYATFLGNEGETKKREVEFAWEAEANQMSAWTNVGLREAPNTVDSGKGSVIQASSSNLAYIIGGGGAGLLLIVLAVVGLAIHHKKRQVAKALAEATRA